MSDYCEAHEWACQFAQLAGLHFPGRAAELQIHLSPAIVLCVVYFFKSFFVSCLFSPVPFSFLFCLSPFGLISWGRFWSLCCLDFQRHPQIRLGECWGVMDLCSTFPLLRDELSTYSSPDPLQSLKRLRTSISLVGERKGKNCQCITLNFRLFWGELLMSFTVIINQIQQCVRRIIDFD